MLSEHSSQSIRKSTRGLNPCFNGRYSQSGAADYLSFTEELVLILVLMEDTLRGLLIIMEKEIKVGS